MKRILPIVLFLLSSFAYAQTVPLYPGDKKGKNPPKPRIVAKPIKKTEYWDEQKKKKKSEEYTVNGKLHGKCVYYFEDGKIDHNGAYKNGKQDSLWTYYYKDGQKKAEERYYEGKRSGKAKYWYKNGNVYVTGKFIEDLPDSVWTSYYENGQVKSVEEYKTQFRDYKWYSRKDGHFQYWQENGKQESDGYFVNDTLHGPYTEWHSNGNKKSEGQYVKGKKSGKWNEYFLSGKLLEEKEYKDGIDALDREMREPFEKAVKATDEILTPEQRIKYHELLARHQFDRGPRDHGDRGFRDSNRRGGDDHATSQPRSQP